MRAVNSNRARYIHQCTFPHRSLRRPCSHVLPPPVQHFVAMGYFTLIVMRRWRKWARREAGLRRLVERLSIRAAMRSWKETVQRVNLLVLLHRLAIRDALFRWRRKVEDGVACEAADCHHSRKLASRVGTCLATKHILQYGKAVCFVLYLR